MPFHEGVIWCLLAIMALLPAAVRMCPLAPLIYTHLPSRAGVHLFESKSCVVVLSTPST